MRHTYFEIHNFKGIKKARLDFGSQPRGRIFTLVGLNESGKTTVLEAMNWLGYKSETLDPLDLPGYAIVDAHDLIPIAERSNFNDAIFVEAGFEPDAKDEVAIADYLRKELGFRISKPVGRFSIKQRYQFVNSKVKSDATLYWWTIKLVGKGKGARSERQITGDAWLKAAKYISSLLPGVLYFPNFLFEFPDRIYLETAPDEPEKHEYYRSVLQDVLDSIGEGATLDTHVLARAKSSERADKQALESVLLKMSANLTENIFVNWNRIFRRNQGRKEIIVDCLQDGDGPWYVRLRIRDGHELYSITERSLGFRWFFAFLMLTVYRGFRTREAKNVLFLLDEPASNLHPSAQTQLLRSFDRLPEHFALVYTTHSHHLINPDWLENTYVVANEGMEYEQEEDFTARNTLVTLERYRAFAAKHPDQTTYFQPILDVLQYTPSRLDNIPDVVMVEGKNDYYTLKHVQQVLGIGELHLLPGNGAGSLADVIRLYLAWGRNFAILLDSDGEGLSQKQRYSQLFGESVSSRIVTLSDVNLSWANKATERLFTKDERLDIQHAAYPDDAAFSKTHFNRAVQELFLTKKTTSLSDQTAKAFTDLFSFLAQMLKASVV